MRQFLYKFLMRKRIAVVEGTATMIARYSTRQARERYQVAKFNEVWKMARENVPFYRAWQAKYGLPDAIADLNELKDWPILTKADLRNLDNFRRKDVPYPRGHILTGGSTGEPVRLPSWGDSMAGVSQIMGRRAYGIKPGDRTFLLWGHEHLYGTGVERKVNAYKRRFKDWLAGWTRVSAYDLSGQAMLSAFDRFQKCQPKVVIGFSPAILSFVRVNKARAEAVKSVKVVLCTAGPLDMNEKCEIEAFFGARLCMEYGSVECAIMAYTRPSDGEYDVFWHTHLIQAIKDGDEYKNIVTRLTQLYVPIIRYDIGDYLEAPDNEGSVLHVKSVKGRPSEVIHFACGVSFFGALIGDCVKQVAEVISSQIAVDEGADLMEIRVTAVDALARASLDLIKNRIELTVSNADKLTIKVIQVQKLFTTAGGKVPRIVRMK